MAAVRSCSWPFTPTLSPKFKCQAHISLWGPAWIQLAVRQPGFRLTCTHSQTNTHTHTNKHTHTHTHTNNNPCVHTQFQAQKHSSHLFAVFVCYGPIADIFIYDTLKSIIGFVCYTHTYTHLSSTCHGAATCHTVTAEGGSNAEQQVRSTIPPHIHSKHTHTGTQHERHTYPLWQTPSLTLTWHLISQLGGWWGGDGARDDGVARGES